MSDESTRWQFCDRMKRDDLPAMPKAVAEVLDEFLVRQHGIMSGSHGAGLFLDLLADRGFCVEVDSGEVPQLQAALRNAAAMFRQDSIAWAEAQTTFIGPAT